MNPLLVCLTSALVFVGSIAGGPQRSPLRFNEWHHEYVGLAACGVGAATGSKLILRVGAITAADDATQHLYQRINHNLAIRSPLYIGYQATLAKVPVVRQLNAFLDNLLR